MDSTCSDPATSPKLILSTVSMRFSSGPVNCRLGSTAESRGMAWAMRFGTELERQYSAIDSYGYAEVASCTLIAIDRGDDFCS